MKRPLGNVAAAFIALVLATSAATRAQAQTLIVLHSFTNSPDGAFPFAGLLRDAASNLYGTTDGGGTFNTGTVFKLDTSGNETVLYSFKGGSDGAFPSAGLVMDATGNLYGTTSHGGSGGCSFSSGCGTVFKLDAAGNETVLYSFKGGSDGGVPVAGLIMDAAGNVYGTTQNGGSGGGCSFGCGTVFKLDTAGNETVLHSFTGSPGDGGRPVAGLIMDTAGNLYGTTAEGGSGTCTVINGIPVSGCGTVFKLDPAGNETVLHSFAGGSDGIQALAALIMDQAGNLYGTTELGGSFGSGTVFKLDPSGNETVLHTFTGGNDGAAPLFAGLIMDTAGNLYGTTQNGGGSSNCAVGCGTVFKLDTSGNETVLHSFTGSPGDGARPPAGLIMDKTGNLYGTTNGGGASGFGTVFKLTVQTPQQATQTIINSVNALFSQGVLSGGQHNSLVRHLQHAIDLMNAGENTRAIRKLDSFISEVNDLLSSGVLSPSQAASLVSAAESVIAAL
jgi:uncharacterized repeat protein (TIGR03803 family)